LRLNSQSPVAVDEIASCKRDASFPLTLLQSAAAYRQVLVFALNNRKYVAECRSALALWKRLLDKRNRQA